MPDSNPGDERPTHSEASEKLPAFEALWSDGKPHDSKQTPLDVVRKSLLELVGKWRTSREELPLTAMGGESRDRLNRELSEALSSAALTRGRKRRASALDVTDFEAAYDDLVNPRPRPIHIDILVDFGLYAAGGFLGYGINVFSAKGDAEKAALAITAGLLLAGFCTAFKYIKLR